MSVTFFEELTDLPVIIMETSYLHFDDGSAVIKTAFYNRYNGRGKETMVRSD